MHKPKRFISVLAILALACALMFTATAASAVDDTPSLAPVGAQDVVAVSGAKVSAGVLSSPSRDGRRVSGC
jgi:hypothetical protein